MASTTPQFITTLNQTIQSVISTCRPWSTFFDITSLGLPSSVSDATTRVSQNLAHFRTNYTLILLLILFLSILRHPVSLLAFAITLVLWVVLYFYREEPLTVFGYDVSDLVVLVALFAVSVGVLVWSGVWVNVLGAVGIGAVLVGLHAVLRDMSDLLSDDIEASPYANLLSDEDQGGDYTGL